MIELNESEMNLMTNKEIKDLIHKLNKNLKDRQQLKEYHVTFEITGIVDVTVKAYNKAHAKELAEDKWYPEDINYEISKVYVEEDV